MTSPFDRETDLNVRITVRHIDITDDVKLRTADLVEKLQKFDARLSRAEVVFDREGHLETVEGILHIDRDDPVVAKGEADEALTAVDQMVEKLAKILRRRRSQVRKHQGPPKVIVEPDVTIE